MARIVANLGPNRDWVARVTPNPAPHFWKLHFISGTGPTEIFLKSHTYYRARIDGKDEFWWTLHNSEPFYCTRKEWLREVYAQYQPAEFRNLTKPTGAPVAKEIQQWTPA
jgi:hypothetical protein